MVEINPFPSICEEYAERFDTASDNADVQTVRNLLCEVENFLSEHTDSIYAPLFYYLGTSYSNLREHGYSVQSNSIKPEISVEEYNDSLERELYYFRHCLELLNDERFKNPEYRSYTSQLQSQVNTNLANTLAAFGRQCAAMKYYRNALDINAFCGMAEGNIGRILQHYSALIHDPGHVDYMHYFAYHFLKKSLQRNDVHIFARKGFEKCIACYTDEDKETFLEKKLDIESYSLGESEREKRYRTWCLQNHLFLNPLNDLPQLYSCFATDSLQLPSMVTTIEQMEPPKYFGMFNQLKQEYVYARYLLYNAYDICEEIHFADKETHLMDLCDGSQYSVRIEELKTAFRLLYSLFDKTAFLVNDYWKLGIHEHDINYRTIWETEHGRGRKRYSYDNVLDREQNIALKSMFWICKEFNSKFGDEKMPYAKNLAILRNALEHKFVRVHIGSSADNQRAELKLEEDLFYHISEEKLLQYTLELLEIVREWLIDLTMAIHIEEMHHRESYNKKIVRMELSEFEDEWKI